MKISNLIAKLKSIDVPFNADLTDGEFGPFCQRLGDDHQELQRVYHESPVTILHFSS